MYVGEREREVGVGVRAREGEGGCGWGKMPRAHSLERPHPSSQRFYTCMFRFLSKLVVVIRYLWYFLSWHFHHFTALQHHGPLKTRTQLLVESLQCESFTFE